MSAPDEDVGYHGLPVIKPAPWRWYIPTYFHVGGTAGAASVLGAAARLVGRGALGGLAARTHTIALAGELAGAGLLIADLGRPARFVNMLRVFRPTSPMNVGTWILSASGAVTGLELLERWRGRTTRTTAIASAVTGAGLATYTAVLLASTAVPLWQASRRTLPVLFAASSAASVASVLEVLGPRTPAEARAVRAFAIAGKAAELLAAGAVERGVGDGPVRRPLREGRSGWMWRTARLLGAAGLVASLWPGGGRRRELVAGLLGTAAAVATRFAITAAGDASARDPRATFALQRRERAAARPGGRDEDRGSREQPRERAERPAVAFGTPQAT